MTDFLLELRCEEIPARMQLKASDDLARLFTEELAKAGLKPASIDSFVTPRRLALIARDLPLETAAVSEELKGPRTSAPAQALEGFLRKTGLTQDQLEDRDGVWFAVVNKPGRATTDVLAEAVPAVIRAFPWPKSMRWGAASATTESLRWVRPLQGIIALLGGEIVPLSIEGIEAGRETVGHRFHSTGAIRIDGADDYADKLRAAYVIVSHQERQAIIEAKAGEAAAAKGYSVIEDKGLVAENAGLTEWPVPLLGDFDPDFLEVPPEVIQLTLRINQKYFVLRDAGGKLAPAFICTANIEAKDGGVAIVAGNRKVLAARLSDARFFWQQDRKTPLAEQAKKLGRITFHEKLGTVADKVERVAKLAEWLASEGIVPNCDPALARQAAELCKADLVTEMVGEFPELQGVMGGYYARAEGLPDAVADAIRDHYKPVGQGDDVPTAPVTVAVSLADKLDTLVSFFAFGMSPTGSKDPFALRRAALAVLATIQNNNIRLPLFELMKSDYVPDLLQPLLLGNVRSDIKRDIEAFERAGFTPDQLNIGEYTDKIRESVAPTDLTKPIIAACFEIIPFFADRLKVQQKEAGVRHDLIDAVFALGGEDDLVRLLARVKALQSFVATDDGANLLAGYKRAANILKKEGVEQAEAISLSYEPEKAEADLIAALDAAEPQAAQAVAAEEFEGAMAALATLRAPIDAFFETVTVNDADRAKRTTRLALLARVRDAVHNVADFSKITG
ncbi:MULTISPECIES: glycine--tRNA ligase subunit beta [Sphingobium]|jgi:glycyl-tRNA synthetase beta chain|uniref:Glycine--tRNA ligase beta subunit n=1 Tax=Sphingobium yanoikuyae TaxID=13690 RepID=A0A0J9D397_SPHYA|nr:MULTISPECIES: glycine--tRNA ligase subunit beta [Sphingobium]ATP19730.1 glycine--tRNA ligase subunit beta [Sphingobium yanoikuyae]KMW31922.1 glycyl-tRNA synthetase subunit beta [Sphingobium yanoikuyae]TKV44657.1 glycine--tRNA ligase subunit beta [Sphingobium sp. MP9-4]